MNNVYRISFQSDCQATFQFSSVQSLSHIQLFATPWTAACQASLSITNSQSLLKLISIEQVMPSNHLILCHPLLFPPSIFPSIRIFSNESVRHIRWLQHFTLKDLMFCGDGINGRKLYYCVSKYNTLRSLRGRWKYWY